MKMHTILALPLALLLGTSCGEDVGAAVNDAMTELKDVSLDDIENSMSMDRIKEVAGSVMSTISEKLGSVEDAADAESLEESLDPMIEKLSAMKDKLGAALPNADQVKSAMSSLADKFSADSEIMKTLQPVLDKLKSLVG